MKRTASRSSKRMKRQPSNKIEDSFPSLADFHAGQFGKYAGIEKLVAFFAERPENEWPRPTPAELAQIAVSLGDGTDWDSWNAVKVVWECACAQEDMIARVVRFMKTGKERKQLLNWISTMCSGNFKNPKPDSARRSSVKTSTTPCVGITRHSPAA